MLMSAKSLPPEPKANGVEAFGEACQRLDLSGVRYEYAGEDREGFGVLGVGLGVGIGVHVVGLESVGGEIPVGAGGFAPEPIDGPVAGRSGQPGARSVGHAVTTPPLGGDGEGLLGRFLGELKVAEEADQ